MRRLSNSEICRIFGSFGFTELNAGRIEIDPGWIRQNIVTLSLPIVGMIACHRLVKCQLERVFVELQEKELSHLIDVDDFSRNGGCFIPRHTRLLSGGYSKSLSRHSFGIALDINPTAYPYGSNRQQPKVLRDVFSKWGFEVVVEKDPMHFEFVRSVSIVKLRGGEDMMTAFRAYQSEKPEKDCFIDGLYTGENDFGKGRVFLIMRVEKGKNYPAVDGDARIKVYVIPEDKSKKIATHSFDQIIAADNHPVVVEISEIGAFSLHLEVAEGSPILCAVNQHYS